jgi:hypothetical protein
MVVMDEQRKGLELTMAIITNSVQCPNLARRPREADQSLWGVKGWLCPEAAAH